MRKCRIRTALICITVAMVVAWIGLLQTPMARAQASAANASLSGTIYDSSGAVVPDATVTLSSRALGFERKFPAGANGYYSFRLVPPGSYELKVEHAGFKTYVQGGVVLLVGQAATQDITLEVGNVNQQVSVTASAPMLQTENANISSDVTQRQAVELPLNFRNVFSLVTLNSAVQNSAQTQSLLGGGGQNGNTPDQNLFFGFGGGRFGATAFLLDGHWNSTSDWSYILYAPSPDEVQEFKVVSNAFSAQYGWSTGNVLNAITKSGTSSFHGDVYEFLRNSDLDSNFFYSNAVPGKALPLAPFRRNQFGVTAGGPLYIPKLYEHKDKTYIFGIYEGLRQQAPASVTATLPTAAMRTGDFSALLGAQVGTDCLGRPVLAGQIYNPFTTRQVSCNGVPTYVRDPIPGNIITSGFDPVALNMLKYYPNPTSNALANNYTVSEANESRADELSFRVDQNIADKSRMFVKYSQKIPEYAEINEGFFPASDPAGPGNKAGENRRDVGLNFSQVFSPTFGMSVNLGWNSNPEGGPTSWVQDAGFKPSTLGLPSFMDTAAGISYFPYTGIQNMTGLGSGNRPGHLTRTDSSLALDFTKVAGSHTLDFGFMGVALGINDNEVYSSASAGFGPMFSFSVNMTDGPNPTAATSSTGFGFASFLLGTGDNTGGFNIQGESALMKHYYGWYVQDDWKATRKLTFNLGLRYDMQTPPTERFNRISWFDYSGTNPISQAVGFHVPGDLVYTSPGSRGAYNAQYTNFAPRLGFSYLVHKNLVARAGFGLFYTPAVEMADYMGFPIYGYTQGTPYVGTADGITPLNLLSNPFPNGPILPVGKALGGLTNVGLSTDAVEHNRPTPYLEQWMFGLEYQFSLNDSIDVTYVGNHGVKMTNSLLGGWNSLPTQDLSMGSALFQQVSNPFYGSITNSGCGLDQPTVDAGQLLLPYPEYCGVTNVQPPNGFSSWNALEVTFTHRWSRALQFVASFTASKYLDNDAGYEVWAQSGGGNIRNYYDLAAEKSLDGGDIPKSLVLTHIYELPVGRGKHFGHSMNRPLDALVGGWEVSGVETFKSGFPLSIGTTENNSNSFGGGQRPNLTGNPHISNPTITQWFNTSAFTQPAAFTFGNVPREMPNLRSPGINNWDLAIEKSWQPSERIRLQLRGEFFNAFNHAEFYAPNTTFGSPTFGQISATLPPRDIQLGLKLYW